MKDVLFSSRSEEWETPIDLYCLLDGEFRFTLDPCATEKNRKCQKYYTKEDDGLQQDWGGHTVFCNPPYGKKIGDWVRKCYEESKKENTIVVLLIPARTDTAYFHDYIYGRSEIRFLRGRLKFGNSKNSAPFPSMIVVFRPDCKKCSKCDYFRICSGCKHNNQWWKCSVFEKKNIDFQRKF